MGIISTFNKTISNFINKNGEFYTALVGTEDFTPESVIDESSDFNCGALCNELEYLRTVSNYYVQSFDLDIAEDENLDILVNAFLNLPRRNREEEDEIYRNRYRAIAIQQSNPRRTTRWAIIDALTYFIADADTIQIVEPFDSNNLYFEIRIEGAQDLTTVIFLNNTNQGYLNQNFVGGDGVGGVISYVGSIVDRIRAAGVDFDIIFIKQFRFTKTIDAFVGAIQFYKTIDAVVRSIVQITKTSDATVV
jgi:hypothetical protein